MLIAALKERFNQYFNSDPAHDTIVWFDAERDYRELLPALQQAGVPLRIVEREGELIRLRSDWQARPRGQRLVIYLPWKRDDPATDWLEPLLYVSDVFTDTLFRFLSHQGVDFPDEPRTRSAIKDVLPRLAAQSLHKGAGYWLHVLSSLDAVREELLGDFAEKLLRFLAQPIELRRELRAKDIETFFFGLLATRYGFEAEAGDDPAALARRLTAHFILARAYQSLGQPADFPFKRQLPAPHLLDACESFLQRWQHDVTYRDSYQRLANQIESQYALADWLTQQPLPLALRVGATFADVERAVWARFTNELAALQTDAEWRTFLNEHRAALARRVDQFWAASGQAGQWHIAQRAADLLLSADECERDLNALSTAEALIAQYAAPAGWWQIERAYREFRDAIDDALATYDLLRQRCWRVYRRYLDRLNGRFVELLAGREHWVFDGVPSQTTTWRDLVHVEPGQRVGVIFVDALRFELAQALVDRLRRDIAREDLTLEACVVTLPTITKVAMPALLPDGDQRKVEWAGDDWRVTIGDSGNLANKSEREAYLRARYPRTQIYSEISALNATSTEQIPVSEELYVTFHTALDNLGENAQELALTVFSGLLKEVERAIRKLREAELQTIVVVADHGFLLLDDVAEADKVSVKDVPALKTASRYLVGRNLGFTDQQRFPVPGSADLQGWYPRGIGCFRTPGKYNYAHGGLSLQEIVVPCLVIRQPITASVVKVTMTAPAVINTRFFTVRLQPIASQIFDRARQVRLLLLKGDRAIVTYEQVIEPTGDTDIKVLLPDSASLEIGDKVVWRLLDVATGQVIQEQAAVNQADFF